MMTNVSFAPSTLWLILTSATQKDAWGRSKNRYLAKRREGMGRGAARGWGSEATHSSAGAWGSTPRWGWEPLGERSTDTTHSVRAQPSVPLIPVSPL